ncbi:uncharacterized protein E0L32_007924 [Thyridium curvatum]|uniref:DNA polymerase n=1 Tax=Thyridium curvatum TaxID=1093900 RepID=A0A507ATJ6_9PEZI|nr:uncharacterized protein E0L32_007924 [Thyridium curvatum]TPX11063.1 hypothetical protein E0L32_007924 [Thyridium curvatum]
MASGLPRKREASDDDSGVSSVLLSKRTKAETTSSSCGVVPRNAPPRQQHANGSRSHSSHPKSQFESDVLEAIDRVIKQGATGKDQTWGRPPLTGFDPDNQDLCFQQIEAEEGTLDGGATVVRLFGVTKEGHSVMLHVTDFRHYLYVAAPAAFLPQHCAGYKDYLNSKLPSLSCVYSTQLVLREDVYGFRGNQQGPYIKITLSDPKSLPKVRSLIERGDANFHGMWTLDGTVMTYDNIQYVVRFMVDCGISGMSWVEAPKSTYTVLPASKRQSTCQIEAKVHYRDLIAHAPVGEWSIVAPLRILSFDIECAGRKGIFPEADCDPVIQIANIVTRYGEKKPFIRNVFCLGSTGSIVATEVIEHQNEGEMLRNWAQFLLEVDPDVIIGYNISNFDFPYLLDRARYLRVENFNFWTRLKNVPSQAKDTSFSSKQIGNRDTKATNTNGRLQLDLLQLIQRDHQLRSYTLNSVCSQFLGEQKEDVHYTIITELYNGNPESRRRLALYCLKDAYLPQRLMDKLSCLENYTEMARVTGVPFNFLLSRGQQVKFISQLFRKALQKGLVIPNLRSESSSDDQYEGATVIEPARGYYDIPIATLDFASLYPSIIMAHNLCYTTLVDQQVARTLGLKANEDYIITPSGDCFVTTKQRKGILAEILEELLTARKQAKRELAIETDPFKRAVLNGRQLALKISANSVYGLTGATAGKLPCLAIASSTTAFGRQMIEQTRDEVEKRFSILNGYSHDAHVIYGDTDSVMVRFGNSDLAQVMKLGEEAAQHVSARFKAPIKLEFEKVYFPYLLINKKRYAGLFWTRSDHWDKMDTKGIETVRRDNCTLVGTVIERILRMILIERDIIGAQEYVKSVIADLLQNKIDMSKLIITKALTKESYEAKQAHVELARRMRKRDPGSAPALGDRVAYVMVKGKIGSKNFENSEDPMYVLENNIPIDTKYYLENQLSKPLLRIFEPILGDKTKSLLNGSHTRTVTVVAPTVGGLIGFAKRMPTCMGCKRPLKSAGESAVCENCTSRIPELCQRAAERVSDLEVRFSRLWTQCQRCQGSLHCEVICSAKDCPIFYMRAKARKDLQDASKELVRFDADVASTW